MSEFHKRIKALYAEFPVDAAKYESDFVDLHARLVDVLAWLKDPRLSQWPYMEDGAFHGDRAEQIAAIEKTLGETHN